MKRQVVAVLLGSLIALPAFASWLGEDAEPSHFANFTSVKSREQVRAELIAAQKAGEIVSALSGGTYVRTPAQSSTKTREQVRAELIAAQEAGDLIADLEGGWHVR